MPLDDEGYTLPLALFVAYTPAERLQHATVDRLVGALSDLDNEFRRVVKYGPREGDGEKPEIVEGVQWARERLHQLLADMGLSLDELVG